MEVKVNINGSEKNKNEIIYNNIIDKMDELNISKNEQIEYLKQKITYMESNLKSKVILVLTLIIGFLLVLFGIYLILKEVELIGIIMILVGFVGVCIKLLLINKKLNTTIKDSKFDSVDQLKKILNLKLK